MAERIYCSELARTAGSPLHGTAIRVDIWLLVEYPRPWKPKALDDNELPAAVGAHLRSLMEDMQRESGVHLRVQFIKQGASDERDYETVILADARGGAPVLRTGQVAHVRDLLEISPDALLGGSLPEPIVTEPEPETDQEIYLVCTNGQRDVCCARFGLPLFESLRMDFGTRVWQTTHLGGHRYAPNLLCLPSGVIYGYVAPEQGADLVHAHDSGHISTAHLRGRTALAPGAQSAEFYLRQHLGEAGAAMQLHGAELVGGADLAAQVWRCSYRVEGETGTADVALQFDAAAEVALASCGAEEKQIGRYSLDSLTPR